MKRFLLNLVLGVLVSGYAVAQPEKELKRYVSEYPGEHAVILKNQENVLVNLEEGKITIHQDRYVETMYLDNLAGMFSQHSLDYTTFDEVKEIEAGTMVPKKNKYSALKVKDFTYSDKISRSVFYDGGKSVSFMYPSLQPGHKSYLKVRKEITEPRFLPSFYFQRGIPVLDQEYTITAPENVELGWKAFHIHDSLLTFTRTKLKNNMISYTWKVVNQAKFDSESDAPDALYYTPHVITWISSYKIDGKSHKLLGTTDDLYKWYSSLVQGVNDEDSPELKKVVDSLLIGSKTDLETVKRVFYWVQDNIKYIAVEDGMGGFIPRSGKTVCEKRYGDCKDMASIIYKMLDYAGINSHLTWIGSRGIPYRYSDISTPNVDNHMICTYIEDDKHYFLDATGQHTPFGMPTSFIQGKEALIGFDSAKYEVKQVPVQPASRNRFIDSVNIVVEGEKLTGTGKTYLSGYEKIDLTYRLLSTKDEKIFLREYYSKGNNKFLLDSSRVENLKDRDKELEITYAFNIQDYIKSYEKDVYVNLHLTRDLQNSTIKPERKLPIEFPHHGETKYSVVLNIPAGYKVSYLPENVSFKNDRFGFVTEYKRSGNKIILTQKLYSNILILNKEDFDMWNKMVKDLNKAYSEVVVLTKHK